LVIQENDEIDYNETVKVDIPNPESADYEDLGNHLHQSPPPSPESLSATPPRLSPDPFPAMAAPYPDP
jgi:hypothetical protein